MCTLMFLARPDHPWPLLLAGNRDELAGRPWQPPGRHWANRPGVLAGLDCLGGGTWMGVKAAGVTALVMNRHGTLGPAPGKRSRGQLVLEALDWPRAEAAAGALGGLDPELYRPFNLVVADGTGAFWVRNGDAGLEVRTLPPGPHLLTAWDLDDPRDPRIGAHLPRLQAARAPDPDRDDWEDWIALLGSRAVPLGAPPTAAMDFALESGFGTLSSFLLALPRSGRPRFLFAAGPPHRTPFRSLEPDPGG